MKIKVVLFLLFILASNSVTFSGKISLPPVTERTISNGLELVFIENHELPVIYMKLVMAAGSMRDPENKEGLASFTANMLKRGTETRSAKGIADEIDFVGGRMDISANRDAVEITIELLEKHMEVGISILADMVSNPVFDSSEIEKYRRQVLSGIIQSRENPRRVCLESFNRALFGEHPYGHPVMGTSGSVTNIDRKDVIEFHNDFFRPNNTFLVISGDIDPYTAIPALETAFISWERSMIPPVTINTPSIPNGRKVILIDKPGAAQSHIIFGTIGITRQSGFYYPFTVMNYILGAGVSFVNRLMTEVREKGGLTYDIRTVNDFNILPGGFYCAASTEIDSTLKAIEIALAEMEKITKNEVFDEEFNQAIGFYSGYYPISLETPAQWAREISKVKLYELPEDYIEDFVSNIKEVEKDDILNVAEYLIDTDNILFCVVSDASAVESELEKLGEVTTVSLGEL